MGLVIQLPWSREKVKKCSQVPSTDRYGKNGKNCKFVIIKLKTFNNKLLKIKFCCLRLKTEQELTFSLTNAAKQYSCVEILYDRDSEWGFLLWYFTNLATS